MERPETNTFFGKMLLLIFILVIFSPLLKTLISRPAEISVNEKRVLARMPDLSLKTDGLSQFPKQFETFYNDHFGFRNLFIALHHRILVKIFRTSPVEKIVLGKNGYLFYHYKPEKIFEDIQGKNPFTDRELEDWRQILETKNNWLKTKGIKYLLVIAPNKHTIYPEYIPGAYIPEKGTTRLDQFTAYMKKNSDVPVLDLRDTLLNEKSSGNVYYKSDTHWNDRGAFIVYRKLIGEINRMFPERVPVTEISLESSEGVFEEGDLSCMTGMPDDYKEKTVFLRVMPSHSEKRPLRINTVPVRESIRTTCKEGDLNAVIFRDSFFTRVIPFISEHFKNADYIWNNFNHILLKELIQSVKPDIVIEEKAERLLAFPPVRNEEKIHEEAPSTFEKNKTQFNQSGKTILLLSPETGYDKISCMNDLVSEKDPEGIRLKSTGTDPFFLLPLPDSFGSQEKLSIKINITSLAYNDLQVYYSTIACPQYTEDHSMHYSLNKGLNEIYMTLSVQEISPRIPLRIDLGGTVSVFTLHSLEVRK